jgi:hypothetical protein
MHWVAAFLFCLPVRRGRRRWLWRALVVSLGYTKELAAT